ncbi:DNA polymerase kappa-like isoform X2 [Limulus polyphemus]|uniref:DNA polymerase kappa n=1 Tax=Limulus polyphemus TaxID=6850 RepID=A0ABM1TBC7_LIMPO|nr:DNA polymerase kappa-like isoform X2 [Limulus polyphemus]
MNITPTESKNSFVVKSQEEIPIKLETGSAPSSNVKIGLKTMEINDGKAGMDGLDKEYINQVIFNASKGTSFFDHQQKRQQRIDQKIQEMMTMCSQLTEAQKKTAEEKMDMFTLVLEKERDLSRTIVHIDMDAFYAAVEMRDDPSLKEIPMAVGSLSMLSTSNYHARKFGVRAAMPGFIAKKLCPNLIIVPCNFKKYTEVSKQVREIMRDYDPDFLPMSLDEAYLDITDFLQQRKQQLVKQNLADDKIEDSTTEVLKYGHLELDTNSIVEMVVKELRHRIFQKTQLTASAGIAPNMMLAKVCSDKNKPNGQFCLQSTKEAVKDFITTLPVKKVPGIGPVQEQLLRALGITTCWDLWKQRAVVSLLFSPNSANFYMRVAMGLGCTEVKNDSTRKSKSVEETFGEICEPKKLYNKCEELCRELAEDLQSEGMTVLNILMLPESNLFRTGKVVGLKIKTVKFDLRTRSMSLQYPTSDWRNIFRVAKQLLSAEITLAYPEPLKLRLMGVRIANLIHEVPGESQQGLMTDFFYQKNQEKHNIQNNKKQESEFSTEIQPQLSLSNLNLPVSLQFDDHQSIQNNRNVSFCCPVCHQPSQDLYELNGHLDECLTLQSSPLMNVHVGSKGIVDKTEFSDCVRAKTDKKLHTWSSTSLETFDENCSTYSSNNLETPKNKTTYSDNADTLLNKSVPSESSKKLNMVVTNRTSFSKHLVKSELYRKEPFQNTTNVVVSPAVSKGMEYVRSMDTPNTGRPNTESVNKIEAFIPWSKTAKNSAVLSDKIECCESLKNKTYEMESFNKLRMTPNQPSVSMASNSLHNEEFPTSNSVCQEFGCVTESLSCPVCDIQFKSQSLVLLNEHIDNCLNKVAIKEILSSDSSDYGKFVKRKTSRSYEKPSRKKIKTQDIALRHIDEYFCKKPQKIKESHCE